MASLPPKEILQRAQEFIQCAEHAVQNGMFNAGAICCYAAFFWAARAALASGGFDQLKWDHSELRSKFTIELINRKSLYPPNLTARLINSFILRNAAQYELKHPKAKKVRRSIQHVKEFIQQVKEVIAR